jgi:hypothetical protein
MCCCGTKDAPSNRICRFNSVPYGNVVLPGPCAVSDLDDPTESLVAHARLTSPDDRGIDATSAADRARTTPTITSLLEPECFRVASTAISASAMATLKYCKNGAPKMAGPIHGLPSALVGVRGAGMVSWTTQPAGVVLPLMHRKVTLFAVAVYAVNSRRTGFCVEAPDGEQGVVGDFASRG